jgi:hypothetical protein
MPLTLLGATSGSLTVSPPDVAGSNTQTLVATTGTLAPVVSGTAITLTNQTAPEFTGIPSWVKRITVMFQGVSSNGSGNYLIQLGTGSTTYTTSGYLGTSTVSSTAGNNAANMSSGFSLNQSSQGAACVFHGSVTITNINSNSWVAMGYCGQSDAARGWTTGGSVSLSAALTAVRLFIDGTQQFDAGTVNILYE